MWLSKLRAATSLRPLFILIALTMLLVACRQNKNVQLPEYPILRADTAYQLQLGEKFILSTAENSCCRYGWDSAGMLVANLPVPHSLSLDTIYTEPMDPDCAGCSTFTYYVFTCTAEDKVQLVRYVIPMSEDGAIQNGDSTYWQRAKDSYSRHYFISIGAALL